MSAKRKLAGDAAMPRHGCYGLISAWLTQLLSAHTAFENGFVNRNGIRDITTIGDFLPCFRSLKLIADTSNGLMPVDLLGLIFAYSDVGGSGANVRDSNQPLDPQAPPCNPTPCIRESVNLSICDRTSGTPVRIIWFNLYSNTFFDPVYATRRLILDSSTPDNECQCVVLFWKGSEALADLSSFRAPDFKTLVDPVMFEGPAATVASSVF